MARKKDTGLDEIFRKSANMEDTQTEADPVRAAGIGLRISEWERYDKIAGDMHTTRHALAVWALRDFLKRYDAGEIETINRPILPGL